MTSTKEQLVVDLGSRINQRLIQWVEDSRDLFDMAELSEEVADNAVFMALVMMARHLAPKSKREKDEIFAIIGEYYASR